MGGGNLWKISSTSKEIKKMWCLLSSVLEKLFINPFEEHYICIIYDNLPFQWITFCNPSLYIEGHSVAFFSSIKPAVIFEQCKRSKSKKKKMFWIYHFGRVVILKYFINWFFFFLSGTSCPGNNRSGGVILILKQQQQKQN